MKYYYYIDNMLVKTVGSSVKTWKFLVDFEIQAFFLYISLYKLHVSITMSKVVMFRKKVKENVLERLNSSQLMLSIFPNFLKKLYFDLLFHL